ncbi:hypothetical protein OG331_31705 [Streptomyces sp. NBC_01017]|uniref:hypothetical protein n=1 Tax=Streptomyces sp. NBC_01017 TaxID=2903721 RepID=UPI00386DBBBE|nr:hypothetical protein OG331_31705 [Streptomyces sp. NBC_01017]
MGDTERPIPDRLADQHEQAQHLTRTGNGPTVPNEEELLAAAHGAPDMAGFYTSPELVEDEPAAESDGDESDQDPAAAADTAEGGESA